MAKQITLFTFLALFIFLGNGFSLPATETYEEDTISTSFLKSTIHTGNKEQSIFDDDHGEAMTCTERAIINATHCDDNYTYGFWMKLEDITAQYTFQNGTLKEYANGTAVINGTIINNGDSDIQFTVDVTLSGRTDNAGEAPKDHDCSSVDTDDWYYYTTTEGTLTGTMDAAGGVIEVTRYAKAFQIGVGANVTQEDINFSASGWLTVQIISQPSSGSLTFTPELAGGGQHADFNFDLEENGIACDPLIEICDNGIDDDGDGNIDCADGDCSTPLVSSITSNNPDNCPALDNGSILITATGDNLEYSIDGGTTYQASNSFTDLIAGAYNIRVINTATGCEFQGTINLITIPCQEICNNGIDDDNDGDIDCADNNCAAPTIISITPTDPTNCPALDNGIIVIEATGSNLSYSIDAGATYQASNIFRNLPAGNYNISLRNTNTGCEIFDSIDLMEGTCSEICNNGIDDDGNGEIDCADASCGAPNITSIDPNNPNNCPVLDNGSITINATGSDLEYSVDGGATYQASSTFNDLTPGVYNISVRNPSTGCEALDSRFLASLTCSEICDNGIDDDNDGAIDCADSNCGKPSIRSIVPTNPSNCPVLTDGSIEINALGSNLEYSIDDGASYQASNTFNGLSAGAFDIRVRNASTGCEVLDYRNLTAITCTEICDNDIDDDGDGDIDCADGDCGQPIIDGITPTNPSNCPLLSNGSIVINATGNNLEYSIDGGASYQTNNTFNGLAPNNFNIRVRNTSTGCEVLDLSSLSAGGCVEVCNNGTDDDGDGFIDNLDTDCSAAIWIEAECATIGSNWNVIKDASVSGGLYATIQDGLNAADAAPSEPADRLSFDFNITTAGTYKVWGRVNAASWSDDSFWIRMDGGTWYNWRDLNTSGAWEWFNVTDFENANSIVTWSLSPGAHTVDIAYREDGLLIDKIVIAPVADPAPTGLGTQVLNCSVEERICNVVDLAGLDGTTDVVTAFNNEAINIGDASITMEALQFAGSASLDALIINDDHELGSYGIQIGVNSASPSDYATATYTFSQEVSEFNGRLLDIDLEEGINLYGRRNGIIVPFTLSNIGTCVSYDGNHTISSTCPTTDGDQSSSLAHAVNFTFDGAIDELVIESFNQVGGTTGAQTFLMSPNESCSNYTPDCTNKLTDIEFDDGTADWGFFANVSNTDATQSIDNSSQLSGANAAFIAITTPGENASDIQFSQSGKSIQLGKTYNVSFEAKALTNRSIAFSIRKSTADFRSYGGAEVILSTEPQTYTYTFVAQESNLNDVAFIFNLGGAAGSVYLDNINFSEACGTEICDNNIDDDNDGLIDAEDPDCSQSTVCTDTGENLFNNGGFELGNWTPTESFIYGVNAMSNSGIPDWNLGNAKWIETTKATEGSKVLYLNDTDPNNTAAISQGYKVGFSQIINECDTYQVCFDWASFNSSYPNGRSTMSQTALDITYLDADNNIVHTVNLPLGKATPNQSWNILKWTSISLEFQLNGSLTPPANATDILVAISEFGGMANGILLDNTKLSISQKVACPVPTSNCNFIVDAGIDQDNCNQTDITLTATATITGNVGTCTGTPISSFPYTENFDGGTGDFGDWTQGAGDDFDWSSLSGPTGSDDTGPSGAATGSNYIYIESSSTNGAAYTANFLSPCFDLTNKTSADFDFQYHMYGVNTGALYVEISLDNGSTWSTLWSLSGDQGNNWSSETLSLTPYLGGMAQLRFRAVTLAGYLGDIAIDGLTLTTTATNYTYLWSTGETTPSIDVNPNTTTTYTVALSNGTCITYDQVVVDLGSCVEICDNGIDDNGDGQVDCEDGSCGSPSINNITLTNPSNCPDLDNGSIRITASGSNIEYSIDGGTTYQASNIFNDLSANTYTIQAINTVTGCVTTYDENSMLENPSCSEICDNGIDDNNDGLVDCDDGSCSTPTINEVTLADPTNCPDLDNGSITIDAAGSDLEYSIDGGTTYQSSNSFDDLPSGDYTIQVRNSLTDCATSYTENSSLADQSCTEICDNGFDDDGDGEIDCNDGDCGKAIITSITPTDPNNCPALTNGTITVVATGDNLEYSIDNGNTYQSSNQFDNLIKGTYNIRIQNSVTGCLATSVTTLNDSSCNEDCTDGIDNNGDGQIDCEDDACGRPEILEITPENPSNCPVLDDGQIIITASGASLRYSIDNGATFQSARVFSNLLDGTYTIVVRNNETGCEVTHPTDIILTDPICTEICDNGIDDDGDNEIDCADGDCGQPTITDLSFTDPTNCPDVSNGTITITATGSDLEYSIDNGLTYQSNNIFSDLYAGTYVIAVRNSITGCGEDYTANPVIITEPDCDEDCDNGYDDDGNGLIDYQDNLCSDNWPIVYSPRATWLCEGTEYTFEVLAALPGFTYEWNFGTYSSVATAVGVGPHIIEFDAPTGTEAVFPVVYFRAIAPTYEIRDTFNLQVRPAIVITNIAAINPSDCGETDGAINLSIQKQNNACIEVSFDGGNAWTQENRVRFDKLRPGNYNIVARYCDEPCATNSNIVTLSNPTTSSTPINDEFTDLCPGQVYTNTVISNDIVQNRQSTYSIAAPTTQGSITMQSDGSFEYIVADSTFCGVDQFSYTICNQNNTCCATAFATLYLTDLTDPILENVPDDLTISCDEEIPLPPFITAYDNCPSISIDKDEVNTQGLDGCALHNYTITRSWTAEDICGNTTTGKQVLTVEDAIAPDIFRIYTLPNGKKMVAGVMENVSENWKTISFPFQFSQTPLVFAQVVSNRDTSAVTTRIRNISQNQFELKLQQEATASEDHYRENVSWIAIEPGAQTASYLLDAKMVDVSDAISTVNFTNTFDNTPACFTNLQTINEVDAGAIRLDQLGTGSVQLNFQEEESANAGTGHATEKLAYLALAQTGNITNDIGDIIGEVGTVQVNHEWNRIITSNIYYNPVIITQVTSKNDASPVLSRVNMERSGSFDLRLQEWDYLDDIHATETVHYIIIEGSIPLSTKKYCDHGTDSLVLGVDIIAVDNCDPSVKIQYVESETASGINKQTIRTWFAEDACGNNTVYSQVINCQGISLRMKAYLQGALVNNGETSLMRDDLRKKNYIPTTEPYTELEHFTHVGTGGGETVSEELLSRTGNNAIVDWVFIEIKHGENYENSVVTTSALLQRDGEIITAEGDPIISFNNIAHGNYYVKLRHRNHLGAETSYPYTFTANNTPYLDFSDPFTPVRGNTPRVEIDDKLASWSGDLNGDDLTVFQGPNNDVFQMFLQIVLDEQNEDRLSNFISSGYTSKDFNMDGTVIFQGPNNDRSVLLWNTVYNHPDNEQNQSNFVVTTAEVVTQANYDDCARDNTQSFCDFDEDGRLNSTDPDDDNDGVSDGNDIDPYNKYSDSDADGLSDYVETGEDGSYHAGTDTDPLSPCDPHQDNGACIGIDMDGDSLYFNYPVNHAKYDPNDQNACEPNGEAAECSCPDEDGDGYIFVCKGNAETGKTTTRIAVVDWQAQQDIGTVCGPCQQTETTDCEEEVKLLTSTYQTVKGSKPNPNIVNFNIPRGENRTLIIIADFEREHCDDPKYCNPNENPSGANLGGNFAFKNTSNGIPFITAKLSGSAGSISVKSSVDGALKRNLLKYRSIHDNIEKAYHSRELYLLTIDEASIDAVLGNVSAGAVNISLPGVSMANDPSDEAILFAYVFENVAQDIDAISLFKGNEGSNNVLGNFTLPLNEYGYGNPTNQIEDGLLVIGMNSMEDAGFQTLEGFKELADVSVQNVGGGFSDGNEGDGMSTSIQFRNGLVLESLQLQSTGAATSASTGGAGLVFAIQSCYDNSLDAPIMIDSDGDGFYANANPYDAQDDNACFPEVSDLCIKEDKDLDGYYGNLAPSHMLYDVDDLNPCVPFEYSFECAPIDNDNDGYYGNADPDDISFDANDFDSCIPEVGPNCVGLDSDMDGKYGNYPETHPEYDANDTDPCMPDQGVFACNPIDNDADGYYENVDASNPLFDINDNNSCLPVVSSNCYGIDEDGDSFYKNYPPTHDQYDPNDTYECIPDASICNRDDDGDGVTTENDPDDTNPCIPIPGNTNCQAIDTDYDGHYPNFPEDHELHDSNDNNDCIPNSEECTSCATFYGYAQVCINAGTAFEQTIITNTPDYYTLGLLNNYCGPCADYATIGDGSWDDMTTWKNGKIPPYTLLGENVIIRHTLTAHQTIEIKDEASFYIKQGNLHVIGHSLKVSGGTLSASESDINIDGSLDINKSSSNVLLRNGVLTVGQGYTNNGGSKVYYENMCIELSSGDYISNYNLEVFENSSLKVAGNFEYTGNTGLFTSNIMTIVGSKFNIGVNFINKGKITGLIFLDDMLALKVGGNLENYGSWQCDIEQAYCIGDVNQVSSSRFYVSENCSTINNFFSACHEQSSVEICGNGLDDDADGLIDCEDGDCENIFTNGSFNFLPTIKNSSGNWENNRSHIDAAEGSTICLGWEPDAPLNTFVKWFDEAGNVISTNHNLCFNNIRTDDAGTYTLQLTSDTGCQLTKEYTVTVVPDDCTDDNNDGMLTVCKRNSDTEIGTTHEVSTEEWPATKQANDHCGPCASYSSATHGNWDNPSTWENGYIPPYAIETENVRINHNITVSDPENIFISENGHLIIEEGALNLQSDLSNIVITSGTLSAINSQISVNSDLRVSNSLSKLIVTGGSLQVKQKLSHTSGKIVFTRTNVTVGSEIIPDNTGQSIIKAVHIKNTNANIIANESELNFYNINITSGSIELNESCLTVTDLWENHQGTVRINNSDVAIGADWTNNTLSNTIFENANIYLSDGKLKNSGTVSGQINTLYIPNGYAYALSWYANINTACISENSLYNISPIYIGSTDCSNMASNFTGQCFDIND